MTVSDYSEPSGLELTPFPPKICKGAHLRPPSSNASHYWRIASPSPPSMRSQTITSYRISFAASSMVLGNGLSTFTAFCRKSPTLLLILIFSNDPLDAASQDSPVKAVQSIQDKPYILFNG